VAVGLFFGEVPVGAPEFRGGATDEGVDVGVVAGVEGGMEVAEAGVAVDPDGRRDFCFQVPGESAVVLSGDVLDECCEVCGECDGCEPDGDFCDIDLTRGDAFPDSSGGGEQDFGEFVNVMVSDVTSGEGSINSGHLFEYPGVAVAGLSGAGGDP
jgi:hypothetical protein